jgi:hypothetical protein
MGLWALPPDKYKAYFATGYGFRCTGGTGAGTVLNAWYHLSVQVLVLIFKKVKEK